MNKSERTSKLVDRLQDDGKYRESLINFKFHVYNIQYSGMNENGEIYDYNYRCSYNDIESSKVYDGKHYLNGDKDCIEYSLGKDKDIYFEDALKDNEFFDIVMQEEGIPYASILSSEDLEEAKNRIVMSINNGSIDAESIYRLAYFFEDNDKSIKPKTYFKGKGY